MPNTLGWKIYNILINYIPVHMMAQTTYIKKNLKPDCPLMRYRKSPLDVRREYANIQKSTLRPL